MTIKLRGWLFWAFFAFSASSLILAVAAVWFMGAEGMENARMTGFGMTGTTVFYTMLAAAVASGLYAAAVSGLVAFKSGKTVSVEIFFFALWAFCQTFELARIASLALGVAGAGSVATGIATRIALFGRYTGTIAIFAGSLFSVGLKQERGMPILSAALLGGMLFASLQPLNSLAPGINFLAEQGVAPLALSFELALIAMALVDYAIAWRSGRDNAYLRAGLGIAVCFGSVLTLRTTLSPWMASAAVPFLALGTWLYIKSMHDYYLWR